MLLVLSTKTCIDADETSEYQVEMTQRKLDPRAQGPKAHLRRCGIKAVNICGEIFHVSSPLAGSGH